MKQRLEGQDCKVLIGSWPNLIVYNSSKRLYCFVEVKNGRDKVSENQMCTLNLLQYFDIPVRVLHADSEKDFADLMQEIGLHGEYVEQNSYHVNKAPYLDLRPPPHEKVILSPQEKILFDVLASCKTVDEAAEKLRMTTSRLLWRLRILRQRISRERRHLNACLLQEERSPLIKKLFSKEEPLIMEA